MIEDLLAQGFIFINPNSPLEFLLNYESAVEETPPPTFTQPSVSFLTYAEGMSGSSILEGGGSQIADGIIWALPQDEWAWIQNHVSGELPVPFTPELNENNEYIGLGGAVIDSADGSDSSESSGANPLGFFDKWFGFKLFGVPAWIVVILAFALYKILTKKKGKRRK